MSWIAHNGAQDEFLQRTEFEVLFGGAAGPGKTDCLIAAMTRDIHNPNYHGLIVRRTFPQLREIIDRCHLRYPGLGGVYLATEKRWNFPSGSKIDLGHMQFEDDKYNYHGAEYQKIALDESSRFSETQYLYLFSRIRTTDPEINCQILSATNPGGVGHNFIRERFRPGERDLKTYYDPKTGLSRVFVPATVEDNPTLFENDPEYLLRLDSLSPLEKQRQRHGIWDAFEGQVFEELSRNIHGYEDIDLDPEWERICVLDWGYASPFSVGWYAVDYDGVLWRYREWYGCKREELGEDEGADEGLKLQAWECARGILEREQGEKIRRRIADPSIWHPRPDSRRQEARGPVINDDFRMESVHFLKADNSRPHGKAQVHKRLQVDREIDEKTGEILSETPKLKVANSCKGFWRTMPALYADKKNREDVDTNQEDHCLAADTLVCTDKGSQRIADLVGSDGLVLSSSGKYERYRSCRLTRRNTDIVELVFADSVRVRCTPDHRFMLVNDEWETALNLTGKTIRSLSAGTQGVNCISVKSVGVADVYCLTVPKTESFAIEGGMLVSNCYDELRYMCMSRPLRPKKPAPRIPPDSPMGIRNKHIRAKQYAKRYGCSMDVAWNKVR